MARTWRVLTLVASAPLTTVCACNFVFSLDGYEGSTPSDGGVDSCPTGAEFCDDFERSADDLQGNWASTSTSAGELAMLSGTPTGNAL